MMNDIDAKEARRRTEEKRNQWDIHDSVMLSNIMEEIESAIRRGEFMLKTDTKFSDFQAKKLKSRLTEYGYKVSVRESIISSGMDERVSDKTHLVISW